MKFADLKKLTDKETVAYEIAHSLSEHVFRPTTDEVVSQMVADMDDITVNQAKGVLGSLCNKGYLKKQDFDVNGRTLYEFSFPLEN